MINGNCVINGNCMISTEDMITGGEVGDGSSGAWSGDTDGVADPQRSPKDTFITVYGRMPVLEVLQDASLTVDKVLVAEGSRGDSLDRIRALAGARGIAVRTASAHRVKVLAGNGKHDQGVLADVVAPRMEPVEDFVQRPSSGAGGSDVVLVLDGVGNPSNVGMILRTATASGVAGIVLPRVGSPGVDPLVVKASAGVAYRAPILRSRTAADAVRILRAAGWRIVGLDGDAPADLYTTDLPAAVALVLGNETEGVSPDVAELVEHWVSIPMTADVESLNVSTAAAVVCFELLRRRRPPQPTQRR
jgi:23S rRNA (guanosine2251-2'-O)-methyltransferase